MLAWYRPDGAPQVIAHQKEFVQRIGQACLRYDIPFIFELLLYAFPGSSSHTTDYVEDPVKRADHVVESVATFAAPEYGVDLFKLESPLPAATIPDKSGDDGRVQALFDQLGTAAARPWVMLSAGATQDAFRRVLHYAYAAGASGYLAGRAIWWDAGQAFPDLTAMRGALVINSVPYMQSLNRMTDELATPWTASTGTLGPAELANAGPGFRSDYASLVPE